MESNPTMLFVVAAALRNADGEILVQKRPHGKAMAGLWEFPGGKVDSGENPDAALIRELEEELGIVVSGATLKPLTFASEPLEGKHLLLLLYGCDQWRGEPEAIVASEIKWVKPSDLHNLEMPPADGPLVDQLLRLS